jgi:hypothetical protein
MTNLGPELEVPKMSIFWNRKKIIQNYFWGVLFFPRKDETKYIPEYFMQMRGYPENVS